MSKSSLVCRRAEPKDAAEIAKVHVASWRSAYKDLLPFDLLAGLSIDVRRAGWEQILKSSDPRSTSFVVEKEGKIVGFTHVGRAARVDRMMNWGEIYSIYLIEDVWGQGAGSRLMQQALYFLKWAEYDVVQLWVLDGNGRANQFYERCGFKLDDSEQGVKLEQLGDVTVREHRYLLQMAEPSGK